MKISAQPLEPRQVVLDIEVDQQRLDRALEEAYRRRAQRMRIPGFRPGKAPRHIVERMVGSETLLSEAVDQLVPQVCREAIAEQKLQAAAAPRVEVITTSPLQVKATVPLEPLVELGPYEELQVPREPVVVEESDVDEALEELRLAHAQWVPVERAVAFGDKVGLDAFGDVGERRVIDSKDAEYLVERERRDPAEGFARELVGTAPGETKSFTLTLGEHLSDDELAGADARFTATVNWVKERQLPELDDAFASSVGEYEAMESLRSELRREIGRRREETAREAFEEAVLNALLECSRLEVPPQLIEHQAEHVLATFQRNLDRRGLTGEQYLKFAGKTEADLKADLLEEASRQVQRAAVLDALAEAEAITVSEAELDEEIHRSGAGSESTNRRPAKALSDPEIRERLGAALRQRKAVRHLLELQAGAESEPDSERKNG